MYARVSQLYQNPLEMNIETTLVGNSSDPDIFGPPFWFVLHNAAVGYYVNPTVTSKRMMKQFLLSLPIIIPCSKCKEHAYDYLKNRDLDYATQSRSHLFEFFVDFHNFVNERGRRPVMCLEDAKNLYGFNRYGMGGSMKITYQ